ncbi:hypothetical protein ABK040_014520 [Willaertia magna]
MSEEVSSSGGSIDNMVNSDNTFICCYGSEWQTITLPNNKKIRSVIATAAETAILTESNELLFLEKNLN